MISFIILCVAPGLYIYYKKKAKLSVARGKINVDSAIQQMYTNDNSDFSIVNPGPKSLSSSIKTVKPLSQTKGGGQHDISVDQVYRDTQPDFL